MPIEFTTDDSTPPPRDTGAAARLAPALLAPFPREEISLEDVAEVLALLEAARQENADQAAELAAQRVAAKEARMLAAARFAVALPDHQAIEQFVDQTFHDINPVGRALCRSAILRGLELVRLVKSTSTSGNDWIEAGTGESVFRQAPPPESPRSAPQAMAASARRPDSFTLTAHQIAQAFTFATGIPDAPLDPDTAETRIAFGHLSDVKDDDGEPLPPGLFCWLSDSPDEGFHGPLEETPDDRTPAATEITAEDVIDLGLLVGYSITDAEAESWSPADRAEFHAWATATHLHASDNPGAHVPPRPDWLPEPWQGPPEGFGNGPTPFPEI